MVERFKLYDNAMSHTPELTLVKEFVFCQRAMLL